MGYNGPSFSFEDLRTDIGNYQKKLGLEASNPVRITRTTYVFDSYVEDGYEIALINYPRQDKSEKVLTEFAINLAKYLLERFGQNRMSIVFPTETVMLEVDGAEDTHK